MFHVKHCAFGEWSGDGLPDADRERWRFSGVKWSGADPDVETLYCAEALWDAEGDVAYCGVSLYQYMPLIVMSDYFSNVCSVGCFSTLTLYFAKVPC